MLKPRRGNKRNLSVFVPVCCLVAKLCLTLCDPMDCSPPGSLCPWDSPDKITGLGCHFLLQGISPTQRLNLCPLHPLHCRQILYRLSHQGNHHISKCLLTIVPFPSTSETTRNTEKQKHRQKRLNKNQNQSLIL